MILIAYGSEVSTLCQAAMTLTTDENLKVRVVSVPSEGVFRTTKSDYQESILPKGVPVFGLTAGLSVNLEGLVGRNGRVWGLNHFGYSAPYKVLDEKFGFTPDNVIKEVKALLNL